MTSPPEQLNLEELQLPMEGPSLDLGKAIRAQVMTEMKPAHSRSAGERALLVLGVALGCIVLVVVSYGVMGLHGLQRHILATVVGGVVALLATLSVGGSLSPRGRTVIGRSQRSLMVATVVAAWSLYILTNITDSAIGSAVSAPAFLCALRSLLAGALGLAALLWIWRRSDPWTPRLSGALMGACAGCISSAAVGIPCASEAGGHLFIGHWLAVPVLAAAGALAARRVLRP